IRFLEKEKLVIRLTPIIDGIPENDHCKRLSIGRSLSDIIEEKKFSHLKVAKQTLINEFGDIPDIDRSCIKGGILVEQLLPSQGSRESNMAFYVEKWQFLSNAVGEFTELILEYKFDDLIGNYTHYMKNVWHLGFPRYDNVFL